MLRKRLAACFTFGMILMSTGANFCTEGASGENPDGTCIYNETTMKTNARNGCKCAAGGMFNRTCQRTCLQNPQVLLSEVCDQHCMLPCPVQLTYECGSCADFEATCSDGWCASCQSCL